MITKTPDEATLEIKALQEFGTEECTDSPNDRESRVRDNVVLFNGRILDKHKNRTTRQNRGSGLLLTHSGFFLTAYHVIAQHLPLWKELSRSYQQGRISLERMKSMMQDDFYILEPNGRKSIIDPTEITPSTGYDLAILKTFRRGLFAPFMYGIREHDLADGDTVKLFGMQKDGPYESDGVVTDSTVSVHKTGSNYMPGGSHYKYDAFRTDAHSKLGISGGPFVNVDGDWVGIVVSYEGQGKGIPGPCKGTKMRHILNVIQNAGEDLEERVLRR